MRARAVVEVLFLRSDGAQLALRGPHVLERGGPDEPWSLVRVAEGSRGYRQRAVLEVATAHGYLDGQAGEPAEGQAGDTPVAAVQVALVAPGHKREHVEVAELAGGWWAARLAHGPGEPWSRAPTLEGALGAATALEADSTPVQGMAERARRRMVPA